MILSKPTQAFGRFTYETGQSARKPSALGPVIIPFANAVEQTSQVMNGPGFVSSVEAVAASVTAEVYLLGFDLPASSAIVQAIQAGSMGAARYTWGPMVPYGTMTREFQELFGHELAGAPLYQAAPFDQGLVVVVSTTPVVYTAPAADDKYKLVVRGTQNLGCAP